MAGINLGALSYDLILNKGTWQQDIDRAKSDVKSIEAAFDSAGKKISSAGKSLTASVTVPLVGMATAAVKVGMDFDAQMSRVQAIAGATGDELEQLRAQALQLGADTAFSSSEAAQGMENLASAGFTTNEIMAAMPGLLDMAAASGAELGVASEIAASILRGFGMEAEQSGHIANVLAEAAARTNAQVEDMGDAMKYVAPVANAMGLSLESTAAAIGILSDAGIKGSQAGTTLRGALARMTKPTAVMRGVMDELGLSFYDSEGRMKGLSEIVTMLQSSFEGLTEEEQQHAVTVLFGQEAMSGMLALIEAGPDKLDTLTEGLENSEGAAKNMAETMLDNLKGSLEQLGGSLETAAIGLYDLAKEPLQNAIESVTGLVNAFNGLDEGAKKQIISMAGAAAALGPLLLATGKITSGLSGVVPMLASVSGGFKSMGKSAFDAVTGMGKNIGQLGGIGEKISAPFKAIGTRVKDALGPLSKFGSFLQPLTNLLGPLNSGFGMFGKLVGGIFGAGGIVAIALTLLTTLAAGASAAGVDVESMITNVVNGVTQFATNFAQKFQELAPKVLEAVPGMLQAITTGIIDMLDVLLPIGLEMIIMLIQGLAQNAPQIITAAIDIVLKLVDSMIEAAPMLIDAAFQLIIGIVEGLIENADRVIDAAIRIMQVLIDSLVTNLPIIIEKLPDIIIKIVDALIQAAPMLIEAGIQLTIGLAKGLIQAIPHLLRAVADLGKQLLDRIKGFFGIRSPSTVFSGIGTNLIQGLINGITGMFGSIGNAVSNLGGRIKDGVSGIIGKAKSWGSDMMNGLRNGIESMKDKVANAARGVAERISNFLHFTRPDEGPLRDYEEWMPHMLSGMADGIRKNTRRVLDETVQLSQKMADSLKPEMDITAATAAHTTSFTAQGVTPTTAPAPATQAATAASGPLVSVQSMIVRKEDDIRRVSQDLYNYGQIASRARGILAPV